MEQVFQANNKSISDRKQFQKKVLDWVFKMQVSETEFKMSQAADHSLFTSCFALFIFDLFGETQFWPDAKKEQWIDFIQQHQDPQTGFFFLKDFQNQFHEKSIYQLTSFCLSALEILGEKPKFPLSFIRQWDSPTKVLDFLNRKGAFQGRRGSGNMAMFLAIFLTFEIEKNQNNSLSKCIDTWFSWHTRTQNPNTGFWGQSLESQYYQGFQNAFHQFEIYSYWDRSISYLPKIVETVLRLQDKDGFFAETPGGGGCADLDAAHLLVHCGLHQPLHQERVTLSLKKLGRAIHDDQNEDGGFSESKRRPRSINEVFETRYWDFYLRNSNPYLFYTRLKKTLRASLKENQVSSNHWTKIGTPMYESDLWNTWFRCLTLAKIGTALRKEHWNFHSLIGLGYFKGDS